MVFSSAVFLFLFLPVCLLTYYLSRGSNLVLLAFSLLFYAWGEPILVTVMVGTIIVNYCLGLWMDVNHGARVRQKSILILGIGFNLILLGSFKYANFILLLLNGALGEFGIARFSAVDIPLPLGISFFTFQSMSYLIDIYRERTHSEPNIFNFALFKSLFPQIIAGPIVRYHELAQQLKDRALGLALFAEGVERFIIGLAQKVLVADVVAVSVDKIFNVPGGELSFIVSWAGVLLFALQIYFDFSGYSNMAIGLSLMLGFRLPENFNFPYAAPSIQEFWRRWHMTLSRWFRDYLYYPLGGNRKGAVRTAINLFIVFALCGLWHGASLTFVVWGLYHGLFLSLERTRFGFHLSRLPVLLRHCYVLAVVAVGWTIFRAPSFGVAVEMGRAMLGLNGWSNPLYALRQFADSLTLLSAATAALFCFPAFGDACQNWLADEKHLPLFKSLCVGALLIVSVTFVGAQTHRPFIYFRF